MSETQKQTEAQHTPGPLRVRERASRYDIETVGGEITAEVYNNADALLYASAPDLLAACKALLAGPHRGGTIGEAYYTISDDVRAQARSAISRARGGVA